jgi:hypothetical protein
MEPDQLHEQIRAIPFMAGLSNPARAAFVSAVVSVGKQEKVPTGTVLFVQGSQGAAMGCIVLTGEVRISKPNSPELICYAPELLGETKQVNPDAHRNATVDAVTELEVIKFNWTSLKSQLAQIATEIDVLAIEKALEDYAWRHITE